MRPTLYTLLFALLLLVAPTAQAQKDKKAPAHPTPSMRERVRSEKRAYLIQRLSLTAKEADDITPILDELDEKRFQLWREGMALGQRVRQGDKTLTEAELYTFLESSLSARIKEAELEKTSRHRRWCSCRWCARSLPADSLSGTSTSPSPSPSLVGK